MDVNIKVTAPEAIQPVVFEKILGEKPGGGMVANPAFDIPTGTAVGFDNGALKPIKAFRLVKAVLVADTEIEIAKGSGIVVGDFIGNGLVAVESTDLDTTNATKDVVTVTMGVDIAIGTVLYQAADASADAAVPIYTPSFLTGAPVIAGEGDQPIRLVNIANVRKETVNASTEVLALLPTINAV